MRFFNVKTHILLKGVKRKEQCIQSSSVVVTDDDDDDIINKMNTISIKGETLISSFCLPSFENNNLRLAMFSLSLR